MKLCYSLYVFMLTFLVCPFAMQSAMLPRIDQAAKLKEFLQQQVDAMPKRHIALIAFDEDGEPNLLLSKSHVNSKWGFFSGLATEHAEKILSRQTGNVYRTIAPQDNLVNCLDSESGDILNVVTSPYLAREILFARAQNQFRKNFCWVLLENVRKSLGGLVSTGQGTWLKVDESIDIIHAQWKPLEKSLQEFGYRADAVSEFDSLAPVAGAQHSLAIENELEMDIKTIHFLTGESVPVCIENLKHKDIIRVRVPINGVGRFLIRVEFCGDAYLFVLERPIEDVRKILLQHDIVSSEPILFYAIPDVDDLFHWCSAQIINREKYFRVASPVSPQPDMSLMLYNANMAIDKVKLQGSDSVITRGMPLSPEKMIWNIPVFKNNKKYILEICRGDTAYQWSLKFLSSICQLMLIEKDNYMPILKMYSEYPRSQECVVPLKAAIRRTQLAMQHFSQAQPADPKAKKTSRRSEFDF